MEAKHTKGNWQVVDTYDQDCKIIVWDGDEQAYAPICDMGEIGDMNYAQSLADAKLISAAPELLSAITNLKDEVCKECNIGSDKNLYALFGFVQDAIRAIKKATE